MVITLSLAADDHDDQDITVSTTIRVDPSAPHWQALLVHAVATQAEEGARRIGDQLAGRHALPPSNFIPLAALVPVADSTR